MENFPHLPEIIYSTSDKKQNKIISNLLKEKRIKKIAPRIYTSNLYDSVESIIKRNIFFIISELFPGAILSHRSAFEFAPTTKGNLYLTYKYSKKIKYPGVTINFMEGHKALPTDNKITGNLYASSNARKFLENLQPTRSNKNENKNLILDDIEQKIVDYYISKEINGLNELRDEAKIISKKLKLKKEYEKLDKMIGSLLSTKKSKLKTPEAIALSFGEPYDPKRIDLFNKLYLSLKKKNFPNRKDLNESENSYKNFAFFEAYFSNFIEGTEFTLNEAIKIIDTHTPLPARNQDSHDVLGTYDIVSRKDLMRQTPDTYSDLIELLQQRHYKILKNRPEKNPGEFKKINNQAGNTIFVDHKLVRGTLKKSFDFYKSLEDPFARAAFMMFLISEIHPFDDGNGRIARIMMNAELSKAGESKILIPNVYRIDYLINLKNLSNNANTEGYIQMLERIHKFSQSIYSDSRDEMRQLLEKSNAFKVGEEYVLKD